MSAARRGFMLPSSTRTPRASRGALQETRARRRAGNRQQIVTDYVAGLTDSYAVQLFSEIFIPPVGCVIRYSR